MQIRSLYVIQKRDKEAASFVLVLLLLLKLMRKKLCRIIVCLIMMSFDDPAHCAF